MASKSLSLLVLFVIVSLLSALVPNHAASTDVFGVWQQLDPKDPKVIEIAKFAVTEHNKEAKTNVIFIRVAKAEEQEAGLTYYRLAIAGGEGYIATPEYYLALLESKPGEKVLKLTSFELIQD